LQQEVRDLFGGRGEREAFAGSVVELVGDPVEFGVGDGGEVGGFGEVLAQQPVGVLVGGALPRSVRVAEVDVDEITSLALAASEDVRLNLS
jgi:hypothetical protein